jgi:hypothetical protein
MTQWQGEESAFQALTDELRNRIVPGIAQTPSYVEGYWGWDHSTGKAYDLVLFETEEAARAQKTYLEQMPPPDAPIRFEVARVVEITAHAKAKEPASTTA